MRTYIYILIFLLVGAKLSAQNFEGIAIYKTSSNITMTMDSTKVNTEEQKKLNALIRKSMQKEYELRFNRTESSYAKIESLSKNIGGKEIEVIGLGAGTEGGIYKNIKTKRLVESRDVFGKVFLVKDSLQQYEWELQDETRKIGEYTCYKAIFTKKRKVKIQGLPDPKITAWYTTQISVSTGPAYYWGLPGLIMELNSNTLNMICSKIILNPKEKIKIEEPTKGKVVNGKEFDEIYMKKVMEMDGMYDDKRKKKKN